MIYSGWTPETRQLALICFSRSQQFPTTWHWRRGRLSRMLNFSEAVLCLSFGGRVWPSASLFVAVVQPFTAVLANRRDGTCEPLSHPGGRGTPGPMEAFAA
jgi:hypothetical protein